MSRSLWRYRRSSAATPSWLGSAEEDWCSPDPPALAGKSPSRGSEIGLELSLGSGWWTCVSTGWKVAWLRSEIATLGGWISDLKVGLGWPELAEAPRSCSGFAQRQIHLMTKTANPPMTSTRFPSSMAGHEGST